MDFEQMLKSPLFNLALVLFFVYLIQNCNNFREPFTGAIGPWSESTAHNAYGRAGGQERETRRLHPQFLNETGLW